MIEVEKKFELDEEEIKGLVADAEFVKESTVHDIYYDYPDYRLAKERIFFRNRNGHFELKVYTKKGVANEMVTESEVADYFELDNSVEDFVKREMIVLTDYKNHRRKYKKNDFIIDIDELDFGHRMCEIELVVKTEGDVEVAEERIMRLAEESGFANKKAKPKRKAYLQQFKPEVYNEIYGEK